MQEISDMELFASFIRDNEGKNIQTFSMAGLNIIPVDSIALFEYLSKIKTLRKLEFSYCAMEDLTFSELAKLFIKDSDITNVTLISAQLTYENAKHIIDALSNEKCKLSNLGITGDKLNSESAKYLSDVLKNKNCKLTSLDLIGNELTNEGVSYLSDALKRDSCKLTNLSVCYNQLTDESVRRLSDALKGDNCKLVDLGISGNG